MKKWFYNFSRLLIFWMLMMQLHRLIFILFHYKQAFHFSFKDLLSTAWHGLALDLSASCYLMGIPILLYFLFIFFPAHFFNRLSGIILIVLLCISSIISVIDLNIFREWGVKVNSRAFEFLFNSPGEAFASSASSPVLLSLSIILLNILAGYFLLTRWVKFSLVKPSRNFLLNLFLLLLLASANFLGIRGGLQLTPINQSSAYFSTSPFLNQTALNTEWNLLNSISETHFIKGNIYRSMPDEQAEALHKKLYSSSSDSSFHILKTKRPNIVFIILESFTADLIASLNGEKDVAPFMDTLSHQGILFDHIYASGDRTDKGMISILSGFPSQASFSIMMQPDKSGRLPSVIQTLKDSGYHTSFFYGGESEFFNFRSYLLNSGCEKIMDKKHFSSSQMNSKWGAHDGYVFEKQIENLYQEPQPFFSTLLTLSLHEPFEIPIKAKFPGNDLPAKFRNAASYTDACLQEYFEKAKKQPWYSNTLFILVADHGHRLPKEYDNAFNPGKFRIPLIFYGDVIQEAWKGKRISRIGSQTDIANTLLEQLDIPQQEFSWSKNLLSPFSKDFAFYTFDNGFGWVSPQQRIVFDNPSQKIIFHEKEGADKINDSLALYGKAYLQKVFEEFLQKNGEGIKN